MVPGFSSTAQAEANQDYYDQEPGWACSVHRKWQVGAHVGTVPEAASSFNEFPLAVKWIWLDTKSPIEGRWSIRATAER